MPARKGTRHLTSIELQETAEWILARPEVPSWPEIAAHVERKHGVTRATEALRRRAPLKDARDQRKRMVAVQARQRKPPTTRRINARDAEIQRLRAEIEGLRAQRDELLERNLRLVNTMRIRNIPEDRADRKLSPIDRDPTR